jgi:SprT-like family
MNINLSRLSDPHFVSPDYWIIRSTARVGKPDLGLKENEAARLAIEKLEKLKGSDPHKLALLPSLHSAQDLRSLFQNLDKYLFREVLKDNVSLRFTSSLPRNITGSTAAQGVFDDQIVITLNNDLLRHSARLTIVASLIHQMAHAYLLVCCGYGVRDEDDQRHNLKHGLAFSSIVHTIQDLLVDDARIPLPDLFCCNGTFNRNLVLPRYRSVRNSLHSWCHFNVSDHEDKAACGTYIRQVNAAAKAAKEEKEKTDGPKGLLENLATR